MYDDIISISDESKKLALIEKCAEICHSVNKAFCESICDYSQPKWADAPDWQKDSAIAGVKAHLASGLTMTPSGSHQSWLDQKVKDGWVYGLVKDAEAKTHPCITAYENLPNEQKTKDFLFQSVVHSFFN